MVEMPIHSQQGAKSLISLGSTDEEVAISCTVGTNRPPGSRALRCATIDFGDPRPRWRGNRRRVSSSAGTSTATGSRTLFLR
jgi:hypothetical protein